MNAHILKSHIHRAKKKKKKKKRRKKKGGEWRRNYAAGKKQHSLVGVKAAEADVRVVIQLSAPPLCWPGLLVYKWDFGVAVFSTRWKKTKKNSPVQELNG